MIETATRHRFVSSALSTAPALVVACRAGGKTKRHPAWKSGSTTGNSDDPDPDSDILGEVCQSRGQGNVGMYSQEYSQGLHQRVDDTTIIIFKKKN